MEREDEEMIKDLVDHFIHMLLEYEANIQGEIHFGFNCELSDGRTVTIAVRDEEEYGSEKV